jgi:hypothetical protein
MLLNSPGNRTHPCTEPKIPRELFIRFHQEKKPRPAVRHLKRGILFQIRKLSPNPILTHPPEGPGDEFPVFENSSPLQKRPVPMYRRMPIPGSVKESVCVILPLHLPLNAGKKRSNLFGPGPISLFHDYYFILRSGRNTMNRKNLLLLIKLSVLHFTLTLSTLIASMEALAHFDDPSWTPPLFTRICETLSKILIYPGSLVWSHLQANDFVEWIVVVTNSLLWGAVGLTLFRWIRPTLPREARSEEQS